MIDFTEILPEGEENAMPAGELIHRLRLNNSRELRKLIEAARRHGQIICTAPAGGYFLPKTKDELRRWVNTMRRRAAAHYADIKYARLYLDILDGQFELKVE